MGFIKDILGLVPSLGKTISFSEKYNKAMNEFDNATQEKKDYLEFLYRIEKIAEGTPTPLNADSNWHPFSPNNPLVPIKNAIESGDYENALNIGETYKNIYGIIPFVSYLARCYNYFGLYDQSIQLVDDAIKAAAKEFSHETNKIVREISLYLSIFKIDAYHELHDISNERRTAFECMIEGPDWIWLGEERSARSIARERFYSINREYCEKFLSLKPENRRILLIVNSYTAIPNGMVSVIKSEDLPHNIRFRRGPYLNQLYVIHPVINDFYIPFENHEVELLRDKLNEYCRFVQCLGASYVKISFEKDQTYSNTFNRNRNGNASGSYSNLGGKIQARIRSSYDLREELSQRLLLEQYFHPQGIITLPNDLVWYPTEKDWYYHYQQRMSFNRIASWDEIIETSKTQVFNYNELLTIQAELNFVFASMRGNMTSEEKINIDIHENSILKVHVEF